LERLPRVPFDLDGVKIFAEFEVIKIVDDNNHYPTLLSIEWALDSNDIISLKKR